MSAYDNDLRVTPIEFGNFKVDDGGGPPSGHVFRQDSGHWAARSGHREPGDFVGDFATADDAIRSLIGDPR